MKKIIVIALIILSTEMFGQIIGRSKSGGIVTNVKKQTTESLGPEIIIKKPILPSGDIIVSLKTLEIFGVVKDQYGLTKLEINTIPIDYSESGEFYHELELDDGKQVISIVATNSEWKTSQKQLIFKNKYVPKVLPPKIHLEEPILSENNVANYSTQKITIKGKIEDLLDIDELTINSFNIIPRLKNGVFSISFGLHKGENKFTISATNDEGKSSEKSFIVNYNKSITKPLITIIEPKFPQNKKLEAQENKISIVGKITDKNKILYIKINDIKIDLSTDGEFNKSIDLSEGDNTIILEAKNLVGEISKDIFQVKYIAQITSPLISIVDPFLNKDSIYLTSTNTKMLRGTVKDEYGIESIEINDREVLLNKNSEFGELLSLNKGKNSYLIKAINIKGKVTTKDFSINYKPIINKPIAVNTDSIVPVIKELDQLTKKIVENIAPSTIEKEIIPNVKIENVAPIINIIEPALSTSNELRHTESIITIRGKIEDPAGLSNVLVNNQATTLIGADGFFINLKLNQGTNNVIVNATNIKGLSSEKIFKIITPIDLEGPQIVLIEPTVQRGLKVVRKTDVVDVKGNVTDISGVLEVYVNKRRVNLSPKNEFSTKMYLSLGDNSIIIKAIDNKLNVTQDTFVVNRKIEDIINAGKYYALVIGIDSYEGKHWLQLENAVNDASGFTKVIKENYKFDEVFTLYDSAATRRNIIQQFEWFTDNVTKDDNVLIFYAGHGQFKREYNKGYWVPVDAKSNSVVDFVSNNQIKTLLSGIQSKHTLLISDACFAGDILRGKQTESIQFDPNNMSKYYREVYRKPSRLALTSGSLEQVSDAGKDNHSVFSYFLLKALKDNNSKYIDVSQLFNEFRVAVVNNSEQTPQLQVIRDTNDEGGQFVFIKK